MSDEQLRTRITLLMQDVGWGIEGSYCIDEDAVARILNEHDASLRSQNQAPQEALRGLLKALGAHTVTLGAVIDHMTQHECFCQQADALYRADAESGDALHVAVNHAKAALSLTQET